MTALGPVVEAEVFRGIQEAVPAPFSGPLRQGRAPERAKHGRFPNPQLPRHGLPGPALPTSRPALGVARAPATPAVGGLELRVTWRGGGRHRPDHRPVGPPGWGSTGRLMDDLERGARAIEELGQRFRHVR
jgi:hypothetical protein